MNFSVSARMKQLIRYGVIYGYLTILQNVSAALSTLRYEASRRLAYFQVSQYIKKTL